MESSNANTSFSKFKIIKNLSVISLSFLLIFTAFNGLSMLQTTMNNEEGVGTYTQAILYITYGLSSLLLYKFVVKKLGTKNTQLLGMSMYLPFVAANFYPSWLTLVPSAVVIGIGCTLLWGAQSTYFNECSVLYKAIEDASTNVAPNHDVTYISNKEGTEELAAIVLKQKVPDNQNTQKNPENTTEISPTEGFSTDIRVANLVPECLREENTIKKKENGLDLHPSNHVQNKQKQTPGSLSSTNALFFGFHGLAYCSAQVWSNLISFYVLSLGRVENYNITSNCSCGAEFCNSEQECVDTRIEEVPADIRYIYTGVCVACGIVAVLLIWLFVDHMDRSKGRAVLSWQQIVDTFKFIKNKEQIFLIPLTITTSMLQGFYTADFTKSYIACAWSTSHVGLVTVFYGVASALSSIISGLLIRLFGRKIVFVFALTFNIVFLALLYLWTPDPHQPYVLYLAGGIFGFLVGIFQSQTKALYGVFFQGKEETAFSSHNIYISIGWTLSFVYSEFFCTSLKICILFAIACLALIGYLAAERSFSQRNKRIERP